MKLLVASHLSSLVALFALGVFLLVLAATWYVQSGDWTGTAALVIAAAANLGLALFGRRTEGVLAATIISAFWTVSTSVAFAQRGYETEAWTLLASSLFQGLAELFNYAAAPASSTMLDDPEGFLPPQLKLQQHQGGSTTSYGALSQFVDPLSVHHHNAASASFVKPDTIQARTSSVSSSVGSSSPKSAVRRVPSPFGSHKLSTTPIPLSAAALPNEATSL